MADHHGMDGVGMILTGILTVFIAGYLAAVGMCARRGRGWSWQRTGCALTGTVLAGIGVGPLRRRAMDSFILHMCSHLVVGMLAPLLLAVSAPIPLCLRALPQQQATRLVKVLRHRLLHVLSRPIVAGMINIAGLWLLYTTRVFPGMHHHAWLDLLVHLHLLMAGWLFSTVILAIGPDPRPAGHRTRAVVLIWFMALHAILTQYIYRHPPAGIAEHQAHAGAQLMYYGGDWIDLVLIIGVCHHWYRHTRPRALHRSGASTSQAHG